MSLEKEVDTIRYPAEIVLCNYITYKFSEINGGNQSLNTIRFHSMKMEADGKTVDCDIDSETLCCPIRVCSEGESTNLSNDWTLLGSSIKENDYKNIPRFWPVDWVFPKGKNKVPSHININLGTFCNTEIIISCEVVKPSDASVLASFADVYTEESIKSYEEEESEMSLFNKKNNKEETSKISEETNETEIKEITTGSEEVVDQEEETVDNITANIMEETNMAENVVENPVNTSEAPAPAPEKKTLSPSAKKAIKIGGICLAVAGAATAAFFGAKHFGLIGGDKSKK